MKQIYLAGGCFWGVEKYISRFPGIIETEVGYANGRTANPSYEQVCHENTGHAETVKVVYNENILDLPTILSHYYKVIDPTSINRQGGDIGSQYRTGIYYIDDSDRKSIDNSISELQKTLSKPSVIEVMPLENYYPAEEYHQKYLDKNPNGYCHINLSKFPS